MRYELDSSPGNEFSPDRDRGLWTLARRDLSAREREIWTLMARGYSDATIAQRLAVNSLTVRFHVGNLLVKLGVSERQEAVSLAKQRDLLAAEVRS